MFVLRQLGLHAKTLGAYGSERIQYLDFNFQNTTTTWIRQDTLNYSNTKFTASPFLY